MTWKYNPFSLCSNFKILLSLVNKKIVFFITESKYTQKPLSIKTIILTKFAILSSENSIESNLVTLVSWWTFNSLPLFIIPFVSILGWIFFTSFLLLNKFIVLAESKSNHLSRFDIVSLLSDYLNINSLFDSWIIENILLLTYV